MNKNLEIPMATAGNEETSKPNEIKFKALQDNLPRDNELWDYLANVVHTNA